MGARHEQPPHDVYTCLLVARFDGKMSNYMDSSTIPVSIDLIIKLSFISLG